MGGPDRDPTLAAAKRALNAREFDALAPALGEDERVELLIRAGELGSVKAQYDLGAFYATGDWAGPKSEAEAVKWYLKAAHQGNADAQYNIGLMLLKGEGVPQNSSDGVAWLAKAADQGEDQARALLVQIYDEGLFDVPQDPERAGYWQKRFRNA